jgi:cytochrome c
MKRFLPALVVAAGATAIAAPGYGQFMTSPTVAVPTVVPGGDISAGEAASKKCQACHEFTEGGPNKIGPTMYGIMGQPAASVPNFAYSQVLMDMRDAGLVWNAEMMAGFLTNPREFSPGTKMTFAGIRNEEELANIIAYLVSISPGYVPAPVVQQPVQQAAPTDRRR